MDKYQIEIDESMSTHFKTLGMVLEHEDETFKYLIEICVNKSHKEDVYPIEMTVSAMLREFNLRPSQTKEQLREKMKSYFGSQESYDMFVTSKKLAFEQFLESIRFETMKFIRVDDVKVDIRTRMVIQKEKKEIEQHTVEPEFEGTPYGYFGFGDLILYSWLWSELSFDHNIHLSDVDLVTEGGDFISSVGATGMDAADASIMDYNEDFDTRIEDFDPSGAEMDELGSSGMEDMIDSDSSKGWFDGVFENDGDFDLDFGDW